MTRRFFLPTPMSLLLFGSVACGGGNSPEIPGPVASYGQLPDLSGTTVLVFPVQAVVGNSTVAAVGRELQFAFVEAGLGEEWVLEDALRVRVSRSPQVNIDLDNLPIGHFLQREVRRVGDPLFGQFRRISALGNGRFLFVPILARFTADETDPDRGVWSLTGTVVEGIGGRVQWFGTLTAEPGRADRPSALADLAALVAVSLAPRAAERNPPHDFE